MSICMLSESLIGETIGRLAGIGSKVGGVLYGTRLSFMPIGFTLFDEPTRLGKEFIPLC